MKIDDDHWLAPYTPRHLPLTLAVLILGAPLFFAVGWLMGAVFEFGEAAFSAAARAVGL